MTEKFYEVYFDPSELHVNRFGHLINPDSLHIIQFEYDEEADQVTNVCRVDQNGNEIPETMPMDFVFELDHAGYGDDMSIDDAMRRFDDWLELNTEWRESSRQTYWQPAEYVCIGIIGHIDDGNPY